MKINKKKKRFCYDIESNVFLKFIEYAMHNIPDREYVSKA